MKIRVIGAGFYGCHIAMSLIADGHDVTIHEAKNHIFGGASGSIPARIHQGFHYPRSKTTRDSCQKHMEQFIDRYGQFTAAVPINLYAIAAEKSMVDYAQYKSTLEREMSFLEVNPKDYGLQNVEGAVLTTERHIITDSVKKFFFKHLKENLVLNSTAHVNDVYKDAYDCTIDCSFCAFDSLGIDRYEPCVVGMLRGPTDKAVTIMDGPFGSLYPWNEQKGLNSLSSALWSPLDKKCKSWAEAQVLLNLAEAEGTLLDRVYEMVLDLSEYWPAIKDYKVVGYHTSIRAMPLSGADSRLVDVIRPTEKVIRVRAGKIDAVIHAEGLVKKELEK